MIPFLQPPYLKDLLTKMDSYKKIAGAVRGHIKPKAKAKSKAKANTKPPAKAAPTA